MDILSRIDWERIELSLFDTLSLNPMETGDWYTAVGLEGVESSQRVTTAVDLPLDLAFITRQMIDTVANPWVAYDIVKDVIQRLRRRYSDANIRRDLGFIIAELKKVLVQGRDEQARNIFEDLLKKKELHFWLISGCAGTAIPDRIRARAGARLRHSLTDEKPQRSLFDYAAEEFNAEEAAVALYLDQQQWVLAWFRNFVKTGYSIQGWQPHRVYPDFVAFQGAEKLSTVQVLEIKGLFLKNEDTNYKQDLFELCNEHSKPTPWDHIAQQFANHIVNFQVVFEDEWQRVINTLLTAR